MNNSFEINFDKEGVELKENLFRIFWLWAVLQGDSGTKTLQKIRWTEIKSVYVFKVDAFTVDVICMDFLLKNDKSFEIDERMQGWENLIENLPTYLPGCKSFHEWFTEVAFPAFETNLTQIY